MSELAHLPVALTHIICERVEDQPRCLRKACRCLVDVADIPIHRPFRRCGHSNLYLLRCAIQLDQVLREAQRRHNHIVLSMYGVERGVVGGMHGFRLAHVGFTEIHVEVTRDLAVYTLCVLIEEVRVITVRKRLVDELTEGMCFIGQSNAVHLKLDHAPVRTKLQLDLAVEKRHRLVGFDLLEIGEIHGTRSDLLPCRRQPTSQRMPPQRLESRVQAPQSLLPP
mmetsp:Transcript_48550/g.105308  ORF Transcript_48550/g.105308 Transcript_48550/m.105308 type:complete len:224 (+) Transcript_48550:349-1020(+)